MYETLFCDTCGESIGSRCKVYNQIAKKEVDSKLTKDNMNFRTDFSLNMCCAQTILTRIDMVPEIYGMHAIDG